MQPRLRRLEASTPPSAMPGWSASSLPTMPPACGASTWRPSCCTCCEHEGPGAGVLGAWAAGGFGGGQPIPAAGRRLQAELGVCVCVCVERARLRCHRARLARSPACRTLATAPAHSRRRPPTAPARRSFYSVLLFTAGPLGHMWWKLPGSTIMRGTSYLYWIPVLLTPRLRRWCVPPPARTAAAAGTPLLHVPRAASRPLAAQSTAPSAAALTCCPSRYHPACAGTCGTATPPWSTFLLLWPVTCGL